MATAEKYLNDGTLAANRFASGFRGIDPRRRRFALNPGIYNCELDQRESGRQDRVLPTGLVTFRTVPMAQEDFDNALKNGNNPSARISQITVDFPAAYFLQNALTRFSELGMRELSALTLMDDPLPNEKGKVLKEAFYQSAQGYLAALYPSFADIGHQCPAELKECVTCRLWLLGDPSSGLFEEVVDDRIKERVAKLANQDKVEELWHQVVDSVVGYRDWAQNKWGSLVGELADRKTGAPAIAKLGPAEHHIRRNLHEVEPSEAATAAGFGAEVAAGQAEGFKELASAMRESKGLGSGEDLMRMMIERQNKTDDALASLAESVKTLVDKQSGS